MTCGTRSSLAPSIISTGVVIFGRRSASAGGSVNDWAGVCLANVKEIGKTKRKIARIKTLQRQRELVAAGGGQ